MATAAETFWDVLKEGKIPVAIEICDDKGEAGLAALGVPYIGNDEAEKLILSPNWRDRAAGLVMAIDLVRDKVDEHFDNVHPLVND